MHEEPLRHRCCRFLLRSVAGAILLSSVIWAPTRTVAQTLARPGWRGSGMRVEHWWHDAVLYDISPVDTATASNGPLLEQLTAQLNDLQAMGFDAILLRGIATPVVQAATNSASAAKSQAAANSATVEDSKAAAPAPPFTTQGALPIDERYGSIEQFDRLLAEASRRRLRVIAELPAGDTAFAAEARSWLSHGVSGIYVSGPDNAAAVHALRGILHGFVGERVIVGDTSVLSTRSRSRASRGSDAPDLALTPLRGLDATPADAAALRSSLSGNGRATRATTVWELASAAPAADAAAARARVTVLLSARGGAALRALDLPLPLPPASTADTGSAASQSTAAGNSVAAASTAAANSALAGEAAPTPDPLAEWTRRVIGLHRGNSTLRAGAATVLDRDGDGVLAMVWRGGSGEVLVEVVNLTAAPVQFSLTEDLARLHLRGSFLRTVLRSDSGMGAMPLRAVSLAGYGVYLGQLSR